MDKVSYVLDVLDEISSNEFKESSWGKYLYHATSSNFRTLRPGSHFGSLESARARGEDSVFYKSPVNKVHSYSYKPSGKTVNVEDNWGADSPARSIVTQLHKQNYISKQEHDNLHTKMKGTPGSDTYGDAAQHNKLLTPFLKSKGISTLRYKNEVEKGGHSYVVYDTENLHRVHTFKDPKFMDRTRVQQHYHKY